MSTLSAMSGSMPWKMARAYVFNGLCPLCDPAATVACDPPRPPSISCVPGSRNGSAGRGRRPRYAIAGSLTRFGYFLAAASARSPDCPPACSGSRSRRRAGVSCRWSTGRRTDISGARDVAARIGKELIELVQGPLAALGLHGGRIVEARLRRAGPADDAPEIGPDPVRAALFEGVAGLALILAVVWPLSALERRPAALRSAAPAPARLLLPAPLLLDRDRVAGLGRARPVKIAPAVILSATSQAGAQNGASGPC